MTSPMDLHQVKMAERFEILNAMSIEDLDALEDECIAESKRLVKAEDFELAKRMKVYAASAKKVLWDKKYS